MNSQSGITMTSGSGEQAGEHGGLVSPVIGAEKPPAAEWCAPVMHVHIGPKWPTPQVSRAARLYVAIRDLHGQRRQPVVSQGS